MPSYHLCPSICPSVGLSVIFSAQPTQILCGMRQATQAYISINNKISMWAGNCFLSSLPESPDFSATGNLLINEEAHRSQQKVFPLLLSYLVLIRLNTKKYSALAMGIVATIFLMRLGAVPWLWQAYTVNNSIRT